MWELNVALIFSLTLSFLMSTLAKNVIDISMREKRHEKYLDDVRTNTTTPRCRGNLDVFLCEQGRYIRVMILSY